MYLDCVLVSSFRIVRGLAISVDILVGANTGSLEGLRGDLLILVGNEVNAERELVHTGALAAEIEDANLGVGDTTVEARLRVRLLSITVSGMFFLVRIFPTPLAPFSTIFCAPVPPAVSSAGVDRQNYPYLVLAVAVTSRGTTGHFDGISVVVRRG
jgi:hypothetical protein